MSLIFRGVKCRVHSCMGKVAKWLWERHNIEEQFRVCFGSIFALRLWEEIKGGPAVLLDTQVTYANDRTFQCSCRKKMIYRCLVHQISWQLWRALVCSLILFHCMFLLFAPRPVPDGRLGLSFSTSQFCCIFLQWFEIIKRVHGNPPPATKRCERIKGHFLTQQSHCWDRCIPTRWLRISFCSYWDPYTSLPPSGKLKKRHR